MPLEKMINEANEDDNLTRRNFGNNHLGICARALVTIMSMELNGLYQNVTRHE